MRAFLIALTALVVSSCATVQKLDAAADVHALLVAIRDDDRATFEQLVDRRALSLEIEERLRLEARHDGRLAALAAVLAPGLARAAGDVLVQPGVFRAVAAQHGYSRDTKIPPPLYISQALRRMPDGRVCAVVKKEGPCTLVFALSPDGRWRLSGFEGDVSMLRLSR